MSLPLCFFWSDLFTSKDTAPFEYMTKFINNYFRDKISGADNNDMGFYFYHPKNPYVIGERSKSFILWFGSIVL